MSATGGAPPPSMPYPQTLKQSPQTLAIAAAAANSLPTNTPQTLSSPLPEKETRAQIPSKTEEQEERHKPSSWVIGFRGSRWLLVIAEELWRIRRMGDELVAGIGIVT